MQLSSPIRVFKTDCICALRLSIQPISLRYFALRFDGARVYLIFDFLTFASSLLYSPLLVFILLTLREIESRYSVIACFCSFDSLMPLFLIEFADSRTFLIFAKISLLSWVVKLLLAKQELHTEERFCKRVFEIGASLSSV